MKYGKWHSRIWCIKCGYNYQAPFGSTNLFHEVRVDVCPSCGAEVSYRRLNPQWGQPFIAKIMRRVDTGVWWNPTTWGNGYWEEKQNG